MFLKIIEYLCSKRNFVEGECCSILHITHINKGIQKYRWVGNKKHNHGDDDVIDQGMRLLFNAHQQSLKKNTWQPEYKKLAINQLEYYSKWLLPHEKSKLFWFCKIWMTL